MYTENRPYVVDGHTYQNFEDAPNLGSLSSVLDGENGTRSYSGLYSDKDKLPHYTDLKTGSSALLVDSSEGLHYLFYESTTDTWYEC